MIINERLYKVLLIGEDDELSEIIIPEHALSNYLDIVESEFIGTLISDFMIVETTPPDDGAKDPVPLLKTV